MAKCSAQPVRLSRESLLEMSAVRLGTQLYEVKAPPGRRAGGAVPELVLAGGGRQGEVCLACGSVRREQSESNSTLAKLA